MSHKWKIRLWGIVTMLAMIVILLVACEFIMRWIRPDLVPSNKLQSLGDPYIGWKFMPNQKLTGWSEYGRFREIRTNALGFPDGDHDLEHPAGVFRIAVLGDSFTAAVGTDYRKSYPYVLQQRLTKMFPEKTFEVMNFGIPGFGTASEYLTWKYYVSDFKPDLVIVGFFIGNDVANHLKDYPSGAVNRPAFDVVNGQLQRLPFHMNVSEEGFERSKRNWFYNTFLAPSLLYQRYKLMERDARDKLGLKRGVKKAQEGEASIPFWKRSYAPVDWQTYLPEPDPDFQKAWLVTEKMLVLLRDEVQKSGAQFSVVLIPGMESIDPSLFREALVKYPDVENFHFDLDWPRQRLMKFLGQEKISYVDLTPRFQEVVKKGSISDVYFKFDQHLCAAGHGYTAEMMATELKPQIQKSLKR